MGEHAKETIYMGYNDLGKLGQWGKEQWDNGTLDTGTMDK
jgi:hypothetical protein